MKKIIQNIILIFLGISLPIVLVELGLRIIDKPKWNTDAVVGWKYQGADNHINQMGYRGQAIKYSDDDIVILLVGDSQIESDACPFEMLPEQLLERHLNHAKRKYKVFSIGSGGYGNDQQYLALIDYFGKYRADAVYLWQTSDNDIWNNMFPTHWPKDGTIKPTFWLENGQLRGPNYRPGEVILYSPKTKIGILIQRLVHPQRGFDALWERRYLPKPYIPLTIYEGEYLTDWDPLDVDNKKNAYLKDENLLNEKSHLAFNLYPRSERMQYGLDLTRELLNRIRDLCIKNKSKFFVFYAYFPLEERKNGIIVHKKGNSFYKSSIEQGENNQRYVNEGFEIIRLPILLSNWRVSKTDRHLNCEANNRAMLNLSEQIEKRFNY